MMITYPPHLLPGADGEPAEVLVEHPDTKQLTVVFRTCHRCNGTEWVCEFHPDKPWGDAINAGPNACRCGGAGKPCPECNPLSKEET